MQPRYAQIKQSIRDEIASGKLKAGERVASENELLRQHAVSRMTVNRALRELTAEGVLHRVAGVGTFVASPSVARSAVAIQDLRDEITQGGSGYEGQVLVNRTGLSNAGLTQLFEWQEPQPLQQIIVLHKRNATPVVLEQRWINPRVAPDAAAQDFSQTTCTAYLLACAPLQDLEQGVEAVALDATAAKWFELSVAHPALLVKRRSRSHKGVASYVHLYFPSGRYSLHDHDEHLVHLAPQFAQG